MLDEKMEGMFLMGQNPAVGAPNSRLQRKALSKLKWLVVRELVEIESANFWRESPEVERGELKPEDIETEVFFFPAAGHAEKAGAFTNTQRLLQWREKAVDPPGDARSEAWFMHQLALRLIAKAKASNDPLDEPLRALDWWYPEDELGDPQMEAVLAEINGWYTDPGVKIADSGEKDGVVFGLDREGNPHHGSQVNGFAELKADGSTACGAWIYSGVFRRDGVNRANSRKSRDYLGHGWGFAWPSDRRIIYNRASARPDGRPWSERKKLVWWDSEKWTGIDVAGFVQGKAPDYEPEVGAEGLDAIPGDAPFILHEDGLGWIYVPKGLKDGPFPTHYEPLESPVSNELYSHDTNPAEQWFARQENRFAPPGDPRFPYVLTTYRLTEHHTAGGMSRFLSHLAELQPEMFAEISPELAMSSRSITAITFAWLHCAAQSKHAHLLVAGFGHWRSMGKQCTRLRCLIITAQPASCRAGLRMIFYRFPVSRTSQSWKPRRLPATSCLDVCRVDQRSLNFLTNMHRKLGQRSCIQKSVLSEKDKAAGATQSKEKNEFQKWQADGWSDGEAGRAANS